MQKQGRRVKADPNPLRPHLFFLSALCVYSFLF